MRGCTRVAALEGYSSRHGSFQRVACRARARPQTAALPRTLHNTHYPFHCYTHLPAGRNPKLQQFSLTPEQLSSHEYYDSLDEDLNLSHNSEIGGNRRSVSDELDSLSIG
jgi:hypothetical protein